MSAPPAKRSLAGRLSFAMGLSSAALSLAALGLLAGLYLHRFQAHMEEHARRSVTFLTQALEYPLWSLDLAAVRAIGQALAQDDAVGLLEIAGPRGEILFRHETPAGIVLERSAEVIHNGQAIGRTRLGLNDTERNAMLWPLALTGAGLAVLVFVLQYLLHALFFRPLLDKPFASLDRLIGAYSAGDFSPAPQPAPYAEFAPLFGLLQDMGATIRQQVEDMKAGGERLSLALDAANDGLWDWDVATGRTYFSPRYSAMLGYAPHEFGDSHEAWRSRLHPADRERVEARLARYLEGAEPAYEAEFRFRDKAGGWRWILSRGKAVERDPAGRPTRMVGTHVDITARKELELRLADQLAFQQALLDTIPYAVFYKGADTRFLGFNTAYEDVFGIRREDLLGKRVLDLEYLPPADRLAYQAEDEAVIAGVGRVQKEMPIPFADGRTHLTLYSVSGFRSSDGSPGGLIGVIVDITERKRAEEALKASEERFAKAFNASPAPLVISEIDSGRFIAVNERWVQMLGFTREEQIGRTSKEVGIWSDPSRRDEAVGILRREGTLKDFPIEFRTRAGQARSALWSAEVVRLEGADVLLSLIYDYSERQRAEEALRQSEEKFSRLFMLSPDNLALIELETGRFVEMNEGFLRFHGLTREEAVGRTPDELGLFADIGQREEMEAAMRSQGKVENFEVEARYWDGSSRVGSISAQIVEIGGRPLTMCILRDITEIKRMQEIMVQTEKMISVGGIAAGIAHEINNPLGIVLQAAQNLVRRLKPDLPRNREAARAIGLDLDLLGQYMRARKLDVFLEDISSAAVRAAGIIRHMLDFSRRSESRRTVCDLPAIVRKALELARNDYDLKQCYDFKRIRVDLEIGDDLPSVNCTETEIEQVLLNLLRNAAQAMASADPPVADPRIGVRLSALPRGVRIAVEDNGPGVPAAAQRRIFEPFFTTKAPGVGTGLGLSVSYFIVTKGHGGSMQVESAPGKGARFTIDLPAEDART